MVGLPPMLQNATILSRNDRDCQWIREVHSISVFMGQLTEHSPLQLSESCGRETYGSNFNREAEMNF